MLQIENLHKRFGGLTVMDGLNINVAEGETRCIIGPNGTGKTTLFNLITGKIKPDSGAIKIGGRNVVSRRVYEIARLGVSRKFQSPTIFGDLTVEDNLIIAATGRRNFTDLILSRRHGAESRIEEILEKLEFGEFRNDRSGDLSHGQRQWLEIGMVLLNEPDLILLDEPTAGMTLAETARTADLIRQVLHGKTTLVIEHDIAFVRRLEAPVTVLFRGKVMCEGSFEDIAEDEQVRRIYLGENP
ncbi:ATP-binding cassette domain-containing protein [Sneathiella litorea]|uniref:ATP-binding cassette domain-containing protein n=1 Tax=Sneathiella litorea TaxID=2606216 RepID=A0A6L8W6P9_9PROT|nr:ATP-binding cassette domain-containing protein [Sneathiella litorea]MZR30070.1 ATP-binding cassette domain-containing protein [Sneathiella litorea]